MGSWQLSFLVGGLVMMRARLHQVAITASILALGIACGSEKSEFSPGAGGSSGDPSSGGTGMFQASLDASTDDGGSFDFEACAVDKQKGKLAPLDLVLMQDTSGSMWAYASGTTTKWTAIKEALHAFMTDPGSLGLGMGVQFFPRFENNVPNGCTANADCGPSGGKCIYKACSKTGTLCESQADCAGGNNFCTQLQRCSAYQEAICLSSIDCADNNLVPTTCNQPIVRGICDGSSVSCSVADYSGLAAPVAALPGAATAIDGALAARLPMGQTPTHAALQGALAAAKAQASAHPGAVTAVILSTDGIPYTKGKCTDDPDAIAAAAAAGLAGTPSIKTFVIGVLSPQDMTNNATATLNAIAAAGGTTAATIIGASASTQADFIAALQKVRGQSLPCEFDLPVPKAGTPDYDKVNVVYTDPTTNGQTLIKYVGGKAACDPASGGWYYDVDPTSGAKPAEVVLCGATCSTVQKTPGGAVDVVQGCETQTNVPK